jgi:hypothetical protein
MTRGQKGEENPPRVQGGVMSDPPGRVQSYEVDKMLEDSVPAKR